MHEIIIKREAFLKRKGLRNWVGSTIAGWIEPKGGFKITVPSKWEELSAENILFLGEVFPYPDAYAILNMSNKGMAISDKVKLHKEKVAARRFLTYCLVHFFGVRKNFRLLLWCRFFLDADRMLGIFLSPGKEVSPYFFSFLFKEGAIKKNLMPQIHLNKKTYYGPADKLYDLTNNEFELADSCYVRYRTTQDPDMLRMLVATLYREQVHGHRVKYDARQVGKRAEAFAELPDKLQKAIFINYTGMRKYMIDANPHVFKKGGSKTAKSSGWGVVVMSMCQTYNEAMDAGKTLCWDTFRWLKHVKERQIAK